MTTLDFGRYALSISAAAAMLAGCGASQSPIGSQSSIGSQAPIRSQAPFGSHAPMPQATPLTMPRRRPERAGWLLPAARTGRLLYVANGNQVLIFPEKGYLRSPIGMITSGVEYAYGLCVDKGGNLYVANDTNNTVTVYPPGSTTPSQTYSQDLTRPLYPVVDSSGNLWVSNAGNGTVVEYLNGSTSASQVLQSPGTEADGIDFDQQGNLYVAYRSGSGSPGSSIEEFASGSTQGQSLGMALNQPQGLIVDNSGNILVVETGGTNRIDLFPPGAQTPSVEVPIPNTPTQLAIKQNEVRLLVSSLAGIVYGTGYPFRIPPRPPYTKDETQSQIQGVALSDGQSF